MALKRGWGALPERILAPLLPARHEIVALVELRQKARDFRGSSCRSASMVRMR